MTKYKDCHVIYFIRNPYDKFISGYSKITNKLILKMNFDQSKNIHECNKIVNYGNINIKEWMKLEHKNIILFDIKNLSNLDKYINNLLKINIDIDIHPVYDRKRPYIDSDTMNIIYQYYYDDFYKLGYTKDSYPN